MADSWRPISEAPRDGTLMLLFCPYAWASEQHEHYQAVGLWDEKSSQWYFTIPGNYIQTSEIEPTLWQPLLTPPEDK